MTQLLASVPAFLLGLLILQYVFVGARFGRVLTHADPSLVWFHALALAASRIARWTQLLRSNLLDTLGSGYVLVARARGASLTRVLFRHALPNASLPLITSVGVSIGGIIGGAAIIEALFTWPGIGQLRWRFSRSPQPTLTRAGPCGAASRSRSQRGVGPSPLADRRRIAGERLVEVGLSRVDPEARPGELSLGQCQRVAIARAIVADPALLVADEPTSALDALVAASVLALLAAIAERGASVVVVSHDRAMLSTICDRILTMREGVLTH